MNCTTDGEEFPDGKVLLLDGVFVHEAQKVCSKLESAGVPFELCHVSKDDAGIVESHKNNWSTALGSVVNYFNQGGLGVYLRIFVKPEDVDRANAALAQESAPRRKMTKEEVLVWIFVIAGILLFVYAFVSNHDPY